MTDQDFLELVFKELKAVKTEDGELELKHLLAAVSGHVSTDWNGVALKLAIWRWSRLTAEGMFDAELTANERVLYSAFRDAVKLSDRSEFATQSDNDTEFYSELMSSAA